MTYIFELIAAARGGDPNAPDELADFVEHVLERPKTTVGIAFGLAQRGGDARRDQRSIRDGIIRASARRLPPAMAIEEKTRVIAADHDLLAAIAITGLGLPKSRRLRDIIEIAIQYSD